MDKEKNLNVLSRPVGTNYRVARKPQKNTHLHLASKYKLPEGILTHTWQPNVKAMDLHKFRVTFSKPSCVVI